LSAWMNQLWRTLSGSLSSALMANSAATAAQPQIIGPQAANQLQFTEELITAT
jgi:hypothetical protein